MGAINWFIDTLDKKWGEQAMQKKLNEKDELLEGKDEQLGKKDELIEERVPSRAARRSFTSGPLSIWPADSPVHSGIVK